MHAVLRRFAAGTAIVAAVFNCTVSARATTSDCTGRCVDVVVPVPTSVHVTSNAVRLLLPSNYTATTRTYPVIYLLCGAGGNQTEWTHSSPLTSFSANLAAIFVMPDCGGAAGYPGWDSDWSNGQFQWETYYVSVLMPWINANYRVTPGANGIAGLSMGGYGALALAARHPGLFRTAGSFSGLPDTQPPGVSLTSLGVIPVGVWGPSATNTGTWTAHNPTALVSHLRGTALFLSCGTGGTSTGAAQEEQLAAQDHVPFVQALQANGIPFTSAFFQGGEHTWPYFQLEAAWALPQMVAVLGG